jgi:hypothetical protein
VQGLLKEINMKIYVVTHIFSKFVTPFQLK